MANGGEVLTLQLGHYANHVGAHLWNIHEAQLDYTSADAARASGGGAGPQAGKEGEGKGEGEGEGEDEADVLFRAGETLAGQLTYTPRLLLFDLNGALRALPKVWRTERYTEVRTRARTPMYKRAHTQVQAHV